MTPEKIREVLIRYFNELVALGYRSVQFTTDLYNTRFVTHSSRTAQPSDSHLNHYTLVSRNDLLNHCVWMCRQALDKFFDGPAKDVAKAMRWMAYVQGVTDSLGIYSCDELREHSRSGKTEFQTAAEEHQKVCDRCGTDLVYGLCSETTCPFSDHQQICPLGWHNHPERNVEGKKCECDQKQVQVGRVVAAAKELIEHIESCDEGDLLKLDEDQHPPSYMSVLADDLERELKKLG